MNGPWKVLPDGEANFYTLAGKSQWLARVQINGEKSVFQQKAMMAYMAAAPALLDALYTALPFVEDAEADTGYKPGAVVKTIKQIKDAIALATEEL